MLATSPTVRGSGKPAKDSSTGPAKSKPWLLSRRPRVRLRLVQPLKVGQVGVDLPPDHHGPDLPPPGGEADRVVGHAIALAGLGGRGIAVRDVCSVHSVTPWGWRWGSLSPRRRLPGALPGCRPRGA